MWRKYFKPTASWWAPQTWTINDHDTEWQITAYTNNLGKVDSNNFIQTYDSGRFYSPSPDIPIPVASNYKFNGANTDLVLVRGHYNKIEY